jgi:hypothetical protein
MVKKDRAVEIATIAEALGAEIRRAGRAGDSDDGGTHYRPVRVALKRLVTEKRLAEKYFDRPEGRPGRRPPRQTPRATRCIGAKIRIPAGEPTVTGRPGVLAPRRHGAMAPKNIETLTFR